MNAAGRWIPSIMIISLELRPGQPFGLGECVLAACSAADYSAHSLAPSAKSSAHTHMPSATENGRARRYLCSSVVARTLPGRGESSPTGGVVAPSGGWPPDRLRAGQPCIRGVCSQPVRSSACPTWSTAPCSTTPSPPAGRGRRTHGDGPQHRRFGEVTSQARQQPPHGTSARGVLTQREQGAPDVPPRETTGPTSVWPAPV